MARTGVSDSDPGAVAARVTELKKELQRLVRTIVDEEDLKTETVDQAREALFALKELKLRKKRSASLKVDDGLSCPQEFRCPLSKDFMRDPVVVSTGQTYDRPFIQKWLKAGNRTCPLTQQVLSHTILTPNHLIRDMISQWCKCQGIELSDPSQYLNDEDGITESERDRFLSLIGKMSASPPEQKDAARELRSLTKRMPSFRALFGESTDAIPRLLRPLEEGGPVGPEIQEDVITTLLNLSIHDSNKRLVAETPAAVPLLMEALRSGSTETRCNAAAALFTLSAVDSNKALIGRSGALRPLIDLLEEGNPAAVKDAASAIFNICIAHENKVRAVREGAVGVILRKIAAGPSANVDELVAILAMLATHQRAVEEMSEAGGAVPRLLGVIRESGCDRTKENCAAILHSICVTHRSKWREMREEERAHGTLTELSRNGTSRAKRKASGILERLNRAVNLTHTA